MATASFPTVHRCLPPGESRISSSFSCLFLPLSYSSNPSSLISPQSFEFGNIIKHVANRRNLSGSKFRNLRSKSLFVPCEASVDKLASNVSLYNAIIQGMCLTREFGAAKRLYVKMREIGFVPDGKTRVMMLQHLIKDYP